MSQHESPRELVLILYVRPPSGVLLGTPPRLPSPPQASFFKQKGPLSLWPSSESRAPPALLVRGRGRGREWAPLQRAVEGPPARARPWPRWTFLFLVP